MNRPDPVSLVYLAHKAAIRVKVSYLKFELLHARALSVRLLVSVNNGSESSLLLFASSFVLLLAPMGGGRGERNARDGLRRRRQWREVEN